MLSAPILPRSIIPHTQAYLLSFSFSVSFMFMSPGWFSPVVVCFVGLGAVLSVCLRTGLDLNSGGLVLTTNGSSICDSLVHSPIGSCWSGSVTVDSLVS
ncbi:hypothetical protein BO70DRAFT_158162 [Aspergillus heteromorphus CBS 117.55]|uniref:Uncharacterized protein n=1 Tax=Aspergillus heteromorphus CBS 117.55 TaxID=1448321 RepID=A0A317WUL5_9EURO|nr:uncharacterized protein BO70DRAFT_158162 [Aspergillus heteromorphus CBS 117.55]PWY88992.1 hypothetical protein BO70DRAFT_158162 [Aspergillus heteromorphus CBS 117.55]